MRNYIWKEWRDHRTVVFGIAICVPLLLLIARFALPHNVVASEVFVQVAAWGTLAIAVLALGSDLVPGEVRRGRIPFLARMPSDLGVAFAAKLVFLLAAIVGSTAFGFVVGSLVAGWPGVGPEFLGGPLLLVLYAAPWIFAVSCWLPRGALALPATGLALALFALPFYLVHLWHPMFEPTEGDVVFWGAALGLGAFAVAWLSFTQGYRFGRGFLSAGWRGLAATLILFVPAYAYSGYRLQEWSAVDPASEEFRVAQFLRGPTGDHYFVNARMHLRGGKQTPFHALVVDAENGAWRVEGGVDSGFEPTEWIDRWTGSAVMHIDDMSTATKDERNPEWAKMWRTYYDAKTGKRVKSGWSNATLPEVEVLCGAGVPEYRRGWKRIYQHGLGYRVRRGSEQGIDDPFRAKVFPVLERGHKVIVRPGRWLVRSGGRVPDWFLHDPETGAREQIPLPRVDSILPDGRVLIDQVVIDPESGQRWTLPEPHANNFAPIRSTGWFRIWNDEGHAVARLDLKTLRFELARGSTNGFIPAMVEGDSVVGIEDERRIVRVFAGSDKREVIFPR